MEIIDVKQSDNLIDEYIKICNLEWGLNRENMEDYIKIKRNEIINGNKVLSILGLIDNNILIGFVSLFRYDGNERRDLTPWYATMYVKDEYRNHGYSKMLNDAILNEASLLGYNRVYLKTHLINYYEKFGAKFIHKLDNGEILYYIDLK